MPGFSLVLVLLAETSVELLVFLSVRMTKTRLSCFHNNVVSLHSFEYDTSFHAECVTSLVFLILMESSSE